MTLAILAKLAKLPVRRPASRVTLAKNAILANHNVKFAKSVMFANHNANHNVKFAKSVMFAMIAMFAKSLNFE